MEDIKQIKLNIWGVRGGFRSFCHSEDMDADQGEIMKKRQDMRGLVYVSDLNVCYYGLEFIESYKVFTLYRTVNDTSRTGAYMATTLYVPHALKVNNILEVLKAISDAYYKDHYDAFGNPNTNPDYIQAYLQVLAKFASNVEREGKNRKFGTSKQDIPPKIFPYTKIGVVEKFFAEPYRREFLDCQEVMFWDIKYLGTSMPSYGIKFQRSETLSKENCYPIDGIGLKEQFNGGKITNEPSSYEIVKFVCEGKDITGSWRSAFFEDEDLIEIRLKKRFYDEKLYSGKMKGDESPFSKSGEFDYEFSSMVDFTPCTYNVQVKVSNVGNETFTLYANGNSFDVKDGRGSFSIKGDQLDRECKITLKHGDAKFDVKSFTPKTLFVGDDDSSSKVLNLEIDNLSTVVFHFGKSCSGTIRIEWKDLTFKTDDQGIWKLVLPKGLKLNMKSFFFTISEDEYEYEVEVIKAETEFNVRLTPKYFYLNISYSKFLEEYLPKKCFLLKSSNQNTIKCNDENTEFKLHKREKEPLKKKEYKLGIMVPGNNPVLCEYELKYNDNSNDINIVPRLALYYNAIKEEVILNSSKEKLVIPSDREYIVLPTRDWTSDVFNLKKVSQSSYEQYEISKKPVQRQTPSVSGKRPNIQTTTNSTTTGTNSDTPSVHTRRGSTTGSGNQGDSANLSGGGQNRFFEDYLCYYYNDETEPRILKPEERKSGHYNGRFYNVFIDEKRSFTLCFYDDGDKKCQPYMEQMTAVNEQNIENGFEIKLRLVGDKPYYEVKDLGPVDGKKGRLGDWLSTVLGNKGNSVHHSGGGEDRLFAFYYNDETDPIKLKPEERLSGNYDGSFYKVSIDGRSFVLPFYDDGDKKGQPYWDQVAAVNEQNIKNGFEIKLRLVRDKWYYEVKDLRPVDAKKRNRDDWWSNLWRNKKKRKGIVSGGIAFMAIIAIFIVGNKKGWWLDKDKEEPKLAYTIEVNMAHGTQIKSITANVTPEKMGKTDKLDVQLYEGWETVNINVETKGEGTCKTIELKKNDNNRPVPVGYLPHTYDEANNRLIITLVSPAWVALDELLNSGAMPSDKIGKLARIANQYNNADNIKAKCEEEAYNIAISGSVTEKETFSKLFPYSELQIAEEDIDDNGGAISSPEDPIVDAKQRHLNEFKAKLEKVYSVECTKSAITELKNAYDYVKDYPERFDTIKKVTKFRPSEKTQKHWIIDNLIPTQKNFFSIFTMEFNEASNKIDKYCNNFNKAFFSEKQREKMKLLKDEDTFNNLKENRPTNIEENENWKIYDYIKTQN